MRYRASKRQAADNAPTVEFSLIAASVGVANTNTSNVRNATGGTPKTNKSPPTRPHLRLTTAASASQRGTPRVC